MENKTVEYQIKSSEGEIQVHRLTINYPQRTIADNDEVKGPDWTYLGYHKCANCPLDEKKVKYCPVAKNLARVSDDFRQDKSYEEVTAFVKTDGRSYGKKTDLQTALQSLFGLIMASSTCPHMEIFRTMAQFHLPFSTSEETIVRMVGLHLIREYLIKQENPAHEISLQSLVAAYQEIGQVNRGIMERIRSVSQGDANKNAIVILDNFATLLPLEITSGLRDLKEIFELK